MKQTPAVLFVLGMMGFGLSAQEQEHAPHRPEFIFRGSAGPVSVYLKAVTNSGREGVGYNIYLNTKFLDRTTFLHRLTETQFVYRGCNEVLTDTSGNPLWECKVWRIGDMHGHKFDLALRGYLVEKAAPGFRGSLVAFLALLPNGNIGCVVYDWRARKYVVQSDLGLKPDDNQIWDTPSFSRDGKQVACQISPGPFHDLDVGDGPPKPRNVHRITLQISP